ncbi:hypothetical protein KL86DYS2_13453 [uncultured Dysgonomonas sp.]|uniref:Uncharacterized protein n=1 Tax=uncultured Dysgonomonas sp. TaxID=206096 RepID=A0A212KAW6_9BACT|nr:hypothetical protein KL86DYS2_13453 [uncultured Dysgonomonas sp.]
MFSQIFIHLYLSIEHGTNIEYPLIQNKHLLENAILINVNNRVCSKIGFLNTLILRELPNLFLKKALAQETDT